MKYQLSQKLQRLVAFTALGIAAVIVASAARADVIMTMSLSAEETSNMAFANGVFSLLNDGHANTLGDHDVVLDFLVAGTQASSFGGFTGSASATLAGMTAAGSPAGNGSFIVQVFDFGKLAVYDENSTLLLSAELTKSAIQGQLGPAGGQALYLGFGELTGGSIASPYQADSLQVRIKFPQISGGFSVTGSTLDPFTTWTPMIEIMASPIVPEPSLVVQLCAAAWILAPLRRWHR